MNYELCYERGFSFRQFSRQLGVSDKVTIYGKDADVLLDYWLGAGAADGLAFMKKRTVPLPAVEIEFQTPKEVQIDGESYRCTGIFCVSDTGTSILAQLSIIDGFAMEFEIDADEETYAKASFFPVCIYYGDEMAERIKTADKSDLEQIEGFFASVIRSRALSLWCAIQTALLNPATKESIGSPRVEREADSKRLKNGKQGKRVVRYVRHYYINEDALAAIKSETEKRRCTCPAWYVIGHWRHYKNGKSVFVQPYWKGEMRKEKTAIEARQREIVIKET